MAAGIEVVRVLAHLAFSPLLAAASRIQVLVILEVVMFVLVEMALGHFLTALRTATATIRFNWQVSH